jgi:hypothetical protein
VPLPPVNFPTLGWQVADWIETYLVHGPGDVQGQPWEVDDEMAVHLCWAYRVWPQDHPLAGRRLVHHDVFSRPKGRAKSEFAGGITCAEALGPVRCDGFDANGDPVGVPVTYPFIRCLATEEEQAGNTYDNVVYMLENGEAANTFQVDTGLTRTFIKEPGGGEIVPSTSGSSTKDGGKESFAVADETHLYVSDGLRGMYRTVARNTGKRKAAEPWMLDTTTAWHPGERSIAERTAELHAALPLEESVMRKGVLYDHRQGDIPKRFGDDRSLIKAMKVGYGPAAEWMDFHRIVRIVREAEEPEQEAYRYWLNRPRAGASQWLQPDEIEAVLGEVELPDVACFGFDGSESDDHTALVGATPDGDLFTVGIWTPEPGDLRWRQEVSDAVDWCFENFSRVVRFYGDPPWWQAEMGDWAVRHGEAVREWWTNRDTPMAVATGALRTAIRQKSITIDPTPHRTDPQTENGKALLRWHFENARTRKVRVKFDDTAEEAWVVRKERPGSPLKIDSVPAAVLARRAWHDATAEDEWTEPVYARAQW